MFRIIPHFTVGSNKIWQKLANYNTKTKSVDWFPFLKKENIEISDKLAESMRKVNIEKIKETTNLEGLMQNYGITESSAIDFTQAIKDGTFTLEEGQTALQGYQSYLKTIPKSTGLAAAGTKVLSAAMKVLSSIGWMAIITLLTTLISKLTGVVNDFIHADEKLAEKVSSAKEAFQSASQAAKDNSRTIKEISSEYEKLSKGVDNFGNNVSLTAEEYSKYNDIVNQIADMFPELTAGYTEENNAILTLKGNVEGLTAAYKKANQNAYNDFLYGGKDTEGSADDLMEQSYRQLNKNANFDFDGWKAYGVQFSLSSATKNKLLKEMYEATDSADDFNNLLDKYNFSLDPKTISGLGRILPELAGMNGWNEHWFQRDLTLSGFLNYKVDDKSLETLKKNIHDELIRTQKEVDEYVGNTSLVANAYLTTSPTYDKLDEDMKSAASIIINNITEETAIGFEGSKEKVEEWVNKITGILAENTTVKDALIGLFSLDLEKLPIMDTKEIVDIYVSDIAGQMEMTKEEIAKMFGFDEIYSMADNYQKILDQSAIKFSGASAYDVSNQTELGKKYAEIYNGLNSASSELGINTQDEIALLSQCVDETDSWEKAINLCRKKLQAMNGEAAFPDIFALKDSEDKLTPLGELSEKLDSIQNAYKTLSDAMNEYQTNGSYSVDTLQKIMELGDDWLDYLVDENGELKLDTEAVEDLANARLNEMKIRVQNSLIDRIKQIENEADANGYLASTNYTLADSISAIAKSEALESLQNADLSDKKRAEVIEKFEKEWEILNNLFDNTSAGMSTLGGTGMSSVMSDISSCAGLISNVNKELSDNGEISFNTLQSIADKYPELEKYVNNYMGNVEGAQGALVEALKARYQTELDNYYDYCANKMAYDSGYWKNVYNQLPDWIKKLAETYKVDLENCSRYGDAKEKILKNIDEAKDVLAEPVARDYNKDSVIRKRKEDRTYWEERLSENQTLLDEIESYFDTNIDDLNEKLNNVSYITGGDSYDASSSPKTFDWIETGIDRLNTRLDSLKSKADDVYSSWGSRTKSLDAAIQTTTEAIDLQGKAYDRYMQEADSVGLSETQAKLVRDGKIDIDTISDEKINEYQNWYNKAQDCLKTQEGLKTSLNELNRQKFDGIQTRYEDLNSTLEHVSEISQTQIDLAEARGLFANSSYYKEMIALTKSEISNLEKEKKELTKIQDNVPYGTEAWYDMQDAINGIDKQLQEAGISIVRFNNSIRSLNWEIFEYLEESLNRITDEAGFFIDLMSNEKLFDDKGFMTGYADASMALHAANYDFYRQQAQDYYKEVQTLEKQLAKGAGKEVLEQYNSMVDAHRSAVNAAEDEKQAILDLMEDGYNAQLDALDRLIDKKKEQLSAEKNLYDYQKSISEKTDNIASLEKQNSAYADDDSEDAMARIQRIKVELEEAKADLKETEYEKYLSDTETMLDRLSEDYEGWIKEKLDNEEALLADVVKTLQEKGAEITGTLNEIADKYGTYISDNLSAVFNTESPFTTSLTGGIDTIAGKIDGVTAAINSLINRVSEIVNVNTAANPESNGGNKKGTGSGSASASKTSGSGSASDKPASADASSSAVNTNVTQGDGIPRVGDRVKFVSGQYYATEYGTGNTGNECLGQEVYITKIAAEGTKRYHIGRTDRHGQRNLGWVNLSQLRGYRKGTKAADNEWAWTQEEGSEILYRRADKAMLTPLGKGDMIWNNESTKRLWEIANDPNIYNKFIDSVETPGINMPQPASFEKAAHMNTTASIEVGDINISLPNVTNYEDFRNSLIKDGNFEKSVLTMVNNAAVGKSTLGKMRFCR